MSESYGRRIAVVCSQCADIFTRRAVDCGRSKALFCSRLCYADSLRTGRTELEVPCLGCGASFLKLTCEVRRKPRHYCSPACYFDNVDRVALGMAGGSAPRRLLSPIVRFRRSQAGGRARAKSLSPERLREISMKGVKARTSRPRVVGAKRQRLGSARFKVALQWFGPLLNVGGG